MQSYEYYLIESAMFKRFYAELENIYSFYFDFSIINTIFANGYKHKVMNKLPLEHTDDAVIRSIKQAITSIIPKDARVILFGSRARNEAKADSDWDILVLLNKDRVEEGDHDEYSYPLWELGWRINQMIHPIIYSMKEWAMRKGSPFYENVEREGVELC